MDVPDVVRYGQWVTMHGYEGDVYLGRQRGGAFRSARAADAVPLLVLPAPPSTLESHAGRALLPGAAFVLAAEDGTFLQRMQRIGHDAPHAPPHMSCRFALGFAAHPTQRMVVQPPHCANPATAAETGLQLSSPIGITICGDVRDPTSPDNDRARLITLRHHDEPSVVVQWWAGHERLSLEPTAARSTHGQLDGELTAATTTQGKPGDEPIARRLRSSVPPAALR